MHSLYPKPVQLISLLQVKHENKWDYNEHAQKTGNVNGNESKINPPSIKSNLKNSHY